MLEGDWLSSGVAEAVTVAVAAPDMDAVRAADIAVRVRDGGGGGSVVAVLWRGSAVRVGAPRTAAVGVPVMALVRRAVGVSASVSSVRDRDVADGLGLLDAGRVTVKVRDRVDVAAGEGVRETDGDIVSHGVAVGPCDLDGDGDAVPDQRRSAEQSPLLLMDTLALHSDVALPATSHGGNPLLLLDTSERLLHSKRHWPLPSRIGAVGLVTVLNPRNHARVSESQSVGKSKSTVGLYTKGPQASPPPRFGGVVPGWQRT